MQLLITRALSPARIVSMDIDNDGGRADVYLKPDQVSLAIGKGGLNIKLASKLTEYEIDVFRDIDDVKDKFNFLFTRFIKRPDPDTPISKEDKLEI